MYLIRLTVVATVGELSIKFTTSLYLVLVLIGISFTFIPLYTIL